MTNKIKIRASGEAPLTDRQQVDNSFAFSDKILDWQRSKTKQKQDNPGTPRPHKEYKKLVNKV